MQARHDSLGVKVTAGPNLRHGTPAADRRVVAAREGNVAPVRDSAAARRLNLAHSKGERGA